MAGHLYRILLKNGLIGQLICQQVSWRSEHPNSTLTLERDMDFSLSPCNPWFLQSNITSPLFRNPCEQNMIPVWFLWKSQNCLLEFLKRIDSLIKHAARNATCLICYPPLGLENIQKDNHIRSMLNKQMKIWTKHMERPNTTSGKCNITPEGD